MKTATITKTNKRDFSQYPLVVKSHASANKIFFGLVSLGVVLPFVLPESAWLIDSFVFQQLSTLIPSARKLASAALFPNVVHAYVLIMLTLSFLAGIGHFVLLTPRREQLQAGIVMSFPRGRWYLWFQALLGIPVFTALLAFFYIFPGQPTSDPHGSRGQLIVSLMLMTKPGLAIFGGITAAGCFAGWWILVSAFYTLFFLPFLTSSKH